MSELFAVSSAVSADAFFDAFFDDAALFPPGDAPMAQAVPAHRDLRERFGSLVGPFVVPAPRLRELREQVSAGDVVGISLICPAGNLPDVLAGVAAEPRIRVDALEVPGVSDATSARAAAIAVAGVGVPVAVELPRTDAALEVLTVLREHGLRAKLRTGGLRPELFPTPRELAATVQSCVNAGVPFKCTAGLHGAAAHVNPATGFPHLGFLGILTAVDAVLEGGTGITELSETDPSALAAIVSSWSTGQGERARAVFTSFGTCSVLEPVDDLVGLGVLSPTEGVLQ